MVFLSNLVPVGGRRILVAAACAAAAFGVPSSVEDSCSASGGSSGRQACATSRDKPKDKDVVLLQLHRGELGRSRMHESVDEQEVGDGLQVDATELSTLAGNFSRAQVASLVTLPGTVDQPGAAVPAGGNVHVLFMGTSNVVWQTWPDHVHLLLQQLGYTMTSPQLPPSAMAHPSQSRTPVCDDAGGYATLNTPRIGKIGWASWGFAYESRDDCDAQGYRTIAGFRVSCLNAWACREWDVEAKNLVRPSDIAAMASDVHAVVMSIWINDPRQHWSLNVCFGGANIPALDTVAITKEDLLKIIRAIHARNPSAVVFIMSLYPDSAGTQLIDYSVPATKSINKALKDALSQEPNTYLVEYDFPAGVDMYQTLNPGHPNCRGDKVMATSVVDTMFKAKLLERSVGLGAAEECLASNECGLLSTECCYRSAQCYMAQDSICQPFGPGQQ